MTKIKPPALRSGGCIGVVSPSWPGAAIYPHRTDRGMAQLRRLGFEPRLARHAVAQNGFVSDTPQNRAADIHEMFLDPDVRLVLSAIGGDHSCHLLPHLDFELIRSHPKIFVGYSDTTVLSMAIWKRSGLVTFVGPALLTDFAEFPAMFDFTLDAFLAVLSPGSTRVSFGMASEWTDEFLDWGAKRDLERPRRRMPATGWNWVRGGSAQGELVGGCFESLQHLRGTPFWPDSWLDKILFIEASDAKPDVFDGMLMDYENMGVLEQISGLLVGRSFGHTAPQLTVPIGCMARIDAHAKRVELLEPAVG